MAKKNEKPFEGDGAERFFSLGEIHKGKQKNKKADAAMRKLLGGDTKKKKKK